MTPIAIAIPDKATILASTPIYFMMMKVANTPMGRILDIIIEARRLTIKTITTMIQIKISCDNAVSSVPIVSLINPERS